LKLELSEWGGGGGGTWGERQKSGQAGIVERSPPFRVLTACLEREKAREERGVVGEKEKPGFALWPVDAR